MVYNRYGMEHFPGDLAMEAGTWWDYYTPLYLALVGTLYRLISHFELTMFLLVTGVYFVLMTGFYALGRRLGFPFLVAIALAWMSGLYVTSALGAPWTGVRLDMAAARNLYQALLPWLLLWALNIYELSNRPRRDWLIYGLVMGLLCNLHPPTGTFMLGVLGLMLLAGVAVQRFDWRNLVLFSVAALPGFAIIAAMSYAPLADRTVVIAQVTENITYSALFFDLAKANVIFYRPPNWGVLIVSYTLLNLVTGMGLLWARQRGTLSARQAWWLAFGLAQFTGALFLQVIDWLVVLLALLWFRRQREGTANRIDTYAILLLLGMNTLVLILGGIMTGIAYSGMFPPAAALARALIRGIHLPYAGLIVLAANSLWSVVRSEHYPARIAWVMTAVMLWVIGFHFEARIPPLEGTDYSARLFEVGQLLPVDPWVYVNGALLFWWQVVPVSMRAGVFSALLLQAVTRLLGIPAGDGLTLLTGGLVGISAILWQQMPSINSRRMLVAGSAVLLGVIALMPISGPSLVQQFRSDVYPTIVRNWSRTNYQVATTGALIAGRWIQENTEPGSLIISRDPYLRYFMLRPQFGGLYDVDFLTPGTEASARVAQTYAPLTELEDSPEELIAFAYELGADYIIFRSDPALTDHAAVTLVYSQENYYIYALTHQS